MDLVAVFGGTFDPIHCGHLRTVAQVQRTIDLGSVHFVPARQPPHRHAPRASAGHRLEMVRLALAAYPLFVADDRELARPGPSYTVDTLRSFRTELGEARPLGVILGLDAFLGISDWHDWRAILGLAHLLVMQRPGWSPPDTRPDWWTAAHCVSAQMLDTRPGGLIHMVAVQPVEVSASEVRRRLHRGDSVAHQMPAVVASYIQRHGLYQ